jgi:multiple sugar transport system ATP-binding protein
VTLRIEQLEKRFDDKLAVQIDSLAIADGEFFAFVGPSGCGKSTTLNLIAGLEEPSAGTIRVGDRQLNELPPHKRDVAFVFQSYALYPHRTVAQNLAFPLQLAHIPRQQIAVRVREAASLLGIEPLLEKRPGQLSGGERQRVALGRAMVRQPRLFLFDEPLSNLDAPLRAQMRKELKRLHRRLGTTFIYVTHDQEEALSLSDRIAVMRSGRIQQCGTPREIYDLPVNRFVAGFFGSPPMNFLEAKVATENGARLGLLGGHRFLLPASDCLAGRDTIVVGIRPEHVRTGSEAAPNRWPAQISMVELHGGQSYLEIEADGVKVMALGRSEADDQTGQRLWIELPADRLHLFDPASGDRLAVREDRSS